MKRGIFPWVLAQSSSFEHLKLLSQVLANKQELQDIEDSYARLLRYHECKIDRCDKLMGVLDHATSHLNPPVLDGDSQDSASAAQQHSSNIDFVTSLLCQGVMHGSAPCGAGCTLPHLPILPGQIRVADLHQFALRFRTGNVLSRAASDVFLQLLVGLNCIVGYRRAQFVEEHAHALAAPPEGIHADAIMCEQLEQSVFRL
eukprot:TRINITY_DN12641_c0_g1_i9.p2 TRINITY_DN12641_c0_g1~~TRINITY_DN12641_c0_g1_i9.p2  ORF type:complete len:201 (+),score=14.89 TRINITY_DN12641_c0_g1_i9:2469-3071(+)